MQSYKHDGGVVLLAVQAAVGLIAVPDAVDLPGGSGVLALVGVQDFELLVLGLPLAMRKPMLALKPATRRTLMSPGGATVNDAERGKSSPLCGAYACPRQPEEVLP